LASSRIESDFSRKGAKAQSEIRSRRPIAILCALAPLRETLLISRTIKTRDFFAPFDFFKQTNTCGEAGHTLL